MARLVVSAIARTASLVLGARRDGDAARGTAVRRASVPMSTAATTSMRARLIRAGFATKFAAGRPAPATITSPGVAAGAAAACAAAPPSHPSAAAAKSATAASTGPA
ncbi:hypothetical protein BPC006_I0976 [Burkholderia pseudomallei BPC006]|nr:hypothetical protein BPC006_I0976 [Burkholderia pseudomallei BPC006]